MNDSLVNKLFRVLSVIFGYVNKIDFYTSTHCDPYNQKDNL